MESRPRLIASWRIFTFELLCRVTGGIACATQFSRMRHVLYRFDAFSNPHATKTSEKNAAAIRVTITNSKKLRSSKY